MKLNWQKWLDKGDIQKVTVTEKSLNGLKNLIERDLKDSQVIGLSLDRRFATAYSAALAQKLRILQNILIDADESAIKWITISPMLLLKMK